ncbi:hypothetical protein OC846_001497 [Tilletia horrida]|uniref:Protein kinase domain-containing protein n=1 Tax=Tilletia horrida TaxID=155126 RepID=A0AAN6GW91_9BASI|nr:hypothetical protein OC846_001497 [Tilletia horrida]
MAAPPPPPTPPLEILSSSPEQCLDPISLAANEVVTSSSPIEISASPSTVTAQSPAPFTLSCSPDDNIEDDGPPETPLTRNNPLAARRSPRQRQQQKQQQHRQPPVRNDTISTLASSSSSRYNSADTANESVFTAASSSSVLSGNVPDQTKTTSARYGSHTVISPSPTMSSFPSTPQQNPGTLLNSPAHHRTLSTSSIASSLGVAPVPSPAHDRKAHDAYARSQQQAQHHRHLSASSSVSAGLGGAQPTEPNAESSTPASGSSSEAAAQPHNSTAPTKIIHGSPTPTANSSFSYSYRETLNARTEINADGSRTLNQYRMLRQVGRGAYGTVYHAELVDDPEMTFAIKEIGKAKMRRTYRAANMRKMARMRGGRGGGAGGRGGGHVGGSSTPQRAGFSLDPQSAAQYTSAAAAAAAGQPAPTPSPTRKTTLENDPLFLIRHEIAILKKLHHPNVVKLYEVLDDPTQDGLYMVFENCPDGPVIDVSMHEQSESLNEDVAREYFAQTLLGIEYLHSNEIVHRDIKPDNVLLTNNRQICKIVDFGVSEIFMKPDEEKMAKSAGTPAFMSPELCTAGSGDMHAMADDIWALGVTLYCMVMGRLPFEKSQILDLYECIKNDEPVYPSHLSPQLLDLLQGLLRKDPQTRYGIAEARAHPWVTYDGTYPLVSVEENLATVVQEITEEELERAICKITSVFTIARAVQKFKRAGSGSKSRTLSSGASSSSLSVASPASGSISVSPAEGGSSVSLPKPDEPAAAANQEAGGGISSLVSALKAARITAQSSQSISDDGEGGVKPEAPLSQSEKIRATLDKISTMAPAAPKVSAAAHIVLSPMMELPSESEAS